MELWSSVQDPLISSYNSSTGMGLYKEDYKDGGDIWYTGLTVKQQSPCAWKAIRQRTAFGVLTIRWPFEPTLPPSCPTSQPRVVLETNGASGKLCHTVLLATSPL